MSEMLKNKRATRGLRMEELVGEAAEQDDAFWGHDTWADGEEESGADPDTLMQYLQDFPQNQEQSGTKVDQGGSQSSK